MHFGVKAFVVGHSLKCILGLRLDNEIKGVQYPDMTLLENTSWRYNPAWSLTDDDDAIWGDKRLSLKAKGLWGYMRSKPSNWDFSSKRIAMENLDESKSIQRAMRELEECGYLSKRRRSNGRMAYMMGSEPYVRVEPRIGVSRLVGAEVDMDMESFYDSGEYKDEEGKPLTVGEPTWELGEVEVEEYSEEFLKACEEAGVKVCSPVWERWKSLGLTSAV